MTTVSARKKGGRPALPTRREKHLDDLSEQTADGAPTVVDAIRARPAPTNVMEYEPNTLQMNSTQALERPDHPNTT